MVRIVLIVLLIAMCREGVNFKHFHPHLHQEHHQPPLIDPRRSRKLKRP